MELEVDLPGRKTERTESPRISESIPKYDKDGSPYFVEKLVELACQAIFARGTERDVVSIGQEVITKQRVVDERLQDHIHEACCAQIVKSSRFCKVILQTCPFLKTDILHTRLTSAQSRVACVDC